VVDHDQEVYDNSTWQYSTRQNPNTNARDVFVKTNRRILGVSLVQVHDKTFAPENLDELLLWYQERMKEQKKPRPHL
jgi:hypothetical protein